MKLLLLVLFSMPAVTELKCAKGKVKIEYGICTTSYCIEAGCYTPAKYKRVMEWAGEISCGDSGHYSWSRDFSYGYFPKWVNHKCEGHWLVNGKEVSREEYEKLTGQPF